MERGHRPRGAPLGLAGNHGRCGSPTPKTARLTEAGCSRSPPTTSPTVNACWTRPTPIVVATSGDCSPLPTTGWSGFRRVAGVQGTQLVPDLATSLPAPTDGGRTYVFHLRGRGAVFDGCHGAGRRLPARDRAHPPARARPMGVLRSDQGCAGLPCSTDHCDLRERRHRGGRGRPHGDFPPHRPDPEFLYRLALPFADAVPIDDSRHAS